MCVLQVASVPLPGEHRDRGAPAKKKAILESTVEEDSSPRDDESPRLSTSPPDRSGIKDVRKGVMDLTTKDGEVLYAPDDHEENTVEVGVEDAPASSQPISPNDVAIFPSIDATVAPKGRGASSPPQTPSPDSSLPKHEVEEPTTPPKRSSSPGSSPEDNDETDSVGPLRGTTESKRSSLQGTKRKSRESSVTGVPGVPIPDPKRQKDEPVERPRTPEAPKSPRTKARSSALVKVWILPLPYPSIAALPAAFPERFCSICREVALCDGLINVWR